MISIFLGIAGVLMVAAMIIIKAFLITLFVAAVVSVIVKAGQKIANIRKKRSLRRLKELAEREGFADAAETLRKLEEGNQCLVTPVNEKNEEIWDNPTIIQADNPSQDDMPDAAVVSQSGKMIRV